jgi:hypothetical protein
MRRQRFMRKAFKEDSEGVYSMVMEKMLGELEITAIMHDYYI